MKYPEQTFESLEARVFLSAVGGTDGDDQITLARQGDQFVVTVNGVSTDDASRAFSIDASGGNDTIIIDLGPADANVHVTIHGGSGNDTISGGFEADRIYAGDGDDSVNGFGGKDSIYGEAGNDSLRGGGSSDLIDGGDGYDTLRGDAGNDNLSGGGNPDRLRGSDGNDRMDGGSGRDIIAGQAGDDTCFGGNGDDVLDGGDGNDTLAGEAGRDLLTGDSGDDNLVGGSGIDSLSGGAGLDSFDTAAEDVDFPPVPLNLHAELDPQNGPAAALTWEFPNEEMTAYDVQDSTDGGVTWHDAVSYFSDDPQKGVVGELDDGATHVFRVRIDYLENRSAFSAVSNPVTLAPAEAENIQGDGSPDSILLDWQDYSTRETGFQLFMRKTGDASYTKIASIAANPGRGEMTRAVRNLHSDTSYDFFLRTLFPEGQTLDSYVLTTSTAPGRLDIGPNATIPTGKLTLPFNAQGFNPRQYAWTIDWGDGSGVVTIPASSGTDPLTVSHVYEQKDYDASSFIQVTSIGDTYVAAYRWITVAALPA